MNEYSLVYDYRNEMVSPYWIIAIVFGMLLLFYLVFKKKQLLNHKLYALLILACIGSPFGLYIFTRVIKKNNAIKEKIYKEEYSIVEGKVEDYNIKRGKPRSESFTINEVKFNYSNSDFSYGYHVMASEGGPIYRNGQHVRIVYYSTNNPNASFWDKNYILIIEIKK